MTTKAKETVEPKEVETKETNVTKDGAVKQQVVGEEVVLNAGKDLLEKDPTEGIDEKAEAAKDMLDTQKKAEESISAGTSGLNATGISEVYSGLVKDVNSDRPVYETASAAMAALTASGKLSGE